MRERKLDKTIRDYHGLDDDDFFFRYAKTRFPFVVAVQFTPSRDQTRQERVLKRPLGRARKCCSSRAGTRVRDAVYFGPLCSRVYQGRLRNDRATVYILGVST